MTIWAQKWEFWNFSEFTLIKVHFLVGFLIENKRVFLGREIILTGHTSGELDNEGRLLIDNGIFRKVTVFHCYKGSMDHPVRGLTNWSANFKNILSWIQIESDYPSRSQIPHYVPVLVRGLNRTIWSKPVLVTGSLIVTYPNIESNPYFSPKAGQFVENWEENLDKVFVQLGPGIHGPTWSFVNILKPDFMTHSYDS